MRKLEGMKKLLSFLLAFSMVLSYVPMPALAAEGDPCTVTEGCEGTYNAEGICTVCNLAQPVVTEGTEECQHSGGTATCTALAVCEKCNEPYGELAAHTGGEATCKSQAVCTVCTAAYGELAAHSYENGVCAGCGAVCTHAEYAEGKCTVCGAVEPHAHTYTDGVCGCGEICNHAEYAEGKCTVCGMDEPVQEPQVLTITAWRWVDEYEILSEDGTYATLPNAADWETLKSVLPTVITAIVDGAEVEIPVQWECETFPAEGEGQGTYELKAILPAGYVLGEGVTALEVDVDLGTVQQYAITPTKPANGDGSESNPYQITSADELYWFANLVNTKAKDGGNNNAHAKLMNNITVNENVIVDGALTSDTSSLNAWTAMGKTAFASGWFGGSFDGNGKTISGLYVNETKDYYGFIGYLGKGASVKNLTIKDSYFTSTSSILGAVVGYAAVTSVVENCKLIDSIVSGTSSVGGIVGGCSYGEIISTCHVYNSTITGTGDNVGGIAGSAGDYNNEAYIRLCSVNNSSVSGANNVGGILGKGGSLSKTKISACCNYNTSVTATTKYAGGILGYYGHCYSCFVTAKVSATANQGPFVGSGNNSNSAYDSDVYGESKLFTNSMAFTTEEIEAGVATYYLTDTTASSAVYVLWGQKIGEDKYPSWNPDSNPDYIVYRMDDTENGGYIYYNGDAAAEYEPNEDGIYEIADRSDWYKFAKKAKEDPSIDGILTANIDFTGVASNKMANYVIGVTGKAYTGTFDGDGYTVSNLPEAPQSLFDVIGNGGELKNLNLSGAVLTNMDAVCVAGLVYNNLGVISNVTVTDVTVSSGAVAAGIVVDNRGTVTGCTVSDITVTGKTAAGGIAGVNYSGNTIEDCCVVSGTVKAVGAEYDAVAGGICGSSYGGTIKGCTNNADVSAEAGRLETAAGIVGRPDSYSDVSVNIISCSNTGNINGTWAGGISGADSTATHVNISLCYNEGTITGNTAGGIAADGSINADDLIVNCYNAGAVNAVGTRAMAGGIVGDHSNNTIKNCHNYGKVTSAYVAAPISGIDVDVWPGADELINNHAIEGNIDAPNIRPYLDTEGAASSSDAIVVGSTREAFANGTITAELNAGNSETVWYQYTEYPILEERHMHQWSYTLEGTDTIKAECTQTGCDLENNYGGKVSIAAPTELLYDGESKDAVCTYTDWLPDKVDVSYNDIDRVNVTGQNIEASLTYGEATVSISYQIAPRVLTDSMVTISNVTYNGNEKTATVTVKYNSSTTLTAGTHYDVTGTTAATEIGTYTVTVTGKGNYTGTVEKTWTISKGSLSSEIKIESWTYLDDPKEPYVTNNPDNGEVTYTYYISTGRRPTMTGTAHGAETEGGVPKYAGTYYVGASIAETEHYKQKPISPSPDTAFDIYPREVTEPILEGLQPTYPYENGNEIKPTFTLKDDLGNEIPESEYTVAYRNNTAVGTASITVTDNEGGNYIVNGTATFGIVTHSHDWEYSADSDTITATCSAENCPKAILTATAKAPDNPLVYGDSNPKNAYISGDNFAANGASAITVSTQYCATENGTFASYSGDPENAGWYITTFTVADNSNAKVFVKYQIKRAAITPTVSIDGWTYGGQANSPSVTGNTGNGSVTYTYKVKDADDTTYSDEVPTDVGTYTVKATIAETANYEGGSATADFSISKASIEPTVSITGWTYGGNANPPTVTGNTGNGSVTYTYKVKDADDTTYSDEVPTDVGTYTVKATIAETANYEGGSATADFSIGKASIEPTVSITGWAYGGNDNPPTVTGNTGNGSVSYTYKVKDAEDSTYSANVPSAVGSYTVKATIAETANYEGGSATADFTISKASITPTVSITGWTYGEKANTPSVTGNTGNGSVTYTYKVKDAEDSTYSTTAPKDYGDYTVRVTVSATENYSEASVTKDFSIAQREVSITGTTVEASKVYDGNATATITANGTLTGKVNGDKLDFTVGTAVYADANVEENKTVSFTGFALTGEDANNYKLSAQPADVTASITAKEVTVKITANGGIYGGTITGASAEVKDYVGEPAPAVIMTYTGTTNAGDSYNDTAVPTEAGTYTVTATISDPNHTLTGDTDATFVVARAEKTEKPSVSGENETIAGKADGKITGLATAMEYKADGDDTYTPVTDANMTFAAGKYQVRYAQTANYEASEAVDVTIGTGVKLKVTVPENQVGYTLTVDQSEVNYGGTAVLTYTLLPGYTEGTDFAVKVNGTKAELAGGKYTIANITADTAITVEGVADTTPATATVTMKENTWNKFLETITFGIYSNENLEVKVTASDVGSGVKRVEYFKASAGMALDQVEANTNWSAMPAGNNGSYTTTITKQDATRFVCYIRVTDNAGNVSYFSTDGAIFDTTAPAITGVTNGGTYYTTQKAATTDTNSDSFTLNGTSFTGTIPGNPSTATAYEIKAIDKAGNETTVTVTMKPIASLDDTIENLTVNNVTLADKQKIEAVQTTVEDILEHESANATDTEKKALKDIADNCDKLLAEIAKAQAVIDAIKALPDPSKVEPDNKKHIDAYDAAQAAYDALSDNGKKMVDSTQYNKDDLAAVKLALAKYLITEGDGGKWTKGSYKSLSFTANGYYADYGSYVANAYGKFTHIEIDGKTVSADNYTAKAGSTIITLKASYLNTLSLGKHTIQVFYIDGATNLATFRINSTGSNPSTGDNSHMMLFGGMMFGSVMLMAVMLILSKKFAYKGRYAR